MTQNIVPGTADVLPAWRQGTAYPLDLRVALPLIRRAYDSGTLQYEGVVGEGPNCEYSAPCVVGVCLPLDLRAACDRHDDRTESQETSMRALFADNVLTCPPQQAVDWEYLQELHDRCVMPIVPRELLSGRSPEGKEAVYAGFRKEARAALGRQIAELEAKYYVPSER